ncbi:MAG: hypothetical protein ACP5G4_10690, partial [bacterium]
MTEPAESPTRLRPQRPRFIGIFRRLSYFDKLSKRCIEARIFIAALCIVAEGCSFLGGFAPLFDEFGVVVGVVGDAEAEEDQG